MAEQGGFGVVLKIMVSTTLTAIVHVTDVDFPKFKKFLAESTAHDPILVFRPGSRVVSGGSSRLRAHLFGIRLRLPMQRSWLRSILMLPFLCRSRIQTGLR